MSRNTATLSLGLLSGMMAVYYYYSSESLTIASNHVFTGAVSRVARVVCLGDTHGRHAEIDVPDGDVLVHSGDFSMFASAEDIASFNLWLASLPHRHKVVISGNHDSGRDKSGSASSSYPAAKPQWSKRLASLLTNARYLQDEAVELELDTGGVLKVYGSPWQPQYSGFGDSMPEPACTALWQKTIPRDVDVVVTHTPPWGLLDNDGSSRSSHLGSKGLLKVMAERTPLLACFGHIHTPGGTSVTVEEDRLRRWSVESVGRIETKSVSKKDTQAAQRGEILFVNGAVALNDLDSEGYYEMRPHARAIVIDVPLNDAPGGIRS